MIDNFTFARCPMTYFGEGTFQQLDELVSQFGGVVLVVTGARSFAESGRLELLLERLGKRGAECFHLAVEGEPSADLVDSAVSRYRELNIDLVLSIGGGSAIDAGKAISAMLPAEGSVIGYLEGVGTGKAHSGDKVPFIAVPTTAGTGSEATKNAVLRRVGPGGFKNSLRHDSLVPDIAVIDPVLMLSCPKKVTASCGMDAFTQLLESYVSTGATPMTDALAASGIEYASDNLVIAATTGSDDIDVRAGMAYASYISGITLANAGLGLIHGFAASIGGLFDIPHGVVCGTLLGAVTSANIAKLKEASPGDNTFLQKYALVGTILCGGRKGDIYQQCELLIERIDEWTERLDMPMLGDYGVRESDIEAIIEKTGHKRNPARLSREEMRAVLEQRI